MQLRPVTYAYEVSSHILIFFVSLLFEPVAAEYFLYNLSNYFLLFFCRTS